MTAYPNIVQNNRYRSGISGEQYALPHRGDLVRFIKRSTKFSYDQSSYLIGFKDDPNKERDREREQEHGRDTTDADEQQAVHGAMGPQIHNFDLHLHVQAHFAGPQLSNFSFNDMMGSFGSDHSHFAAQIPQHLSPQTQHHQHLPTQMATEALLPQFSLGNSPSATPPCPPGDMPTGPPPRALPPGHTPEAEMEATKIIVNYLNDPAINPYRGSVPVERIQNILVTIPTA